MLILICTLISAYLCVVECTSIVSGPTPSFTHTFEYGEESSTSVYLVCKVDGLGEYHVSWFKNDKKISDNSYVLYATGDSGIVDARYSITTSATTSYNLYIADIGFETARMDTGVYQCKIITDANIVITESSIAEVHIYVTPRERYPVCSVSNSQQSQNEFFEGMSLELLCKSDSGVPMVAMYWLEGNGTNPNNSKVALTVDDDTASLSYALVVNRQYNGMQFTCEMTHPRITVTRRCTLGPFNVYESPVININAVSAMINSTKQSTIFTCETTGGPDVLRFEWVINNLPIHYWDFETKLRHGNVSLEVTVAENSKSAGEYVITCFADYGFTRLNATSMLIVRPEVDATGSSLAPSTAVSVISSEDKKQFPLVVIVIVAVGIILILVTIAIIVTICVLSCRKGHLHIRRLEAKNVESTEMEHYTFKESMQDMQMQEEQAA